MFAKNHLFIIGAGASTSYGFPTGSELKSRAASMLAPGTNEDMPELIMLAKNFNIEPHDFMKLRELLITNTYDNSIDTVIQSSSDPRRDINLDKLIPAAKLITAKIIIAAEDEKGLIIDTDDDWYGELFRKLYEAGNRTYDGFIELGKKVRFVTFNYDRSLEKYFLDRLIERFPVSSEEVALNLNTHFQFIHPHGQVGTLFDKKASSFREYNNIWSNAAGVNAAIVGIKFITEKITHDEQEVFEEVKSLVRLVDKIHFVGFGYNRENMNRIGFTDEKMLRDFPLNKVYGTLMGKTPQEIAEIHEIYKVLNYHMADTPDNFIGERESAYAYMLRAPLH